MRARSFAGLACLVLGLSFAGITKLVAEAPIAAARPRVDRPRIVESARAYLGVPYLYGGVSREGLDCSGLVWRVYHDSFGQAPLAAMPRRASDLFAFAEPLERSKLEPGDLVFFDTTGGVSHVGIYEGEGFFIHAASEGPKTGVIESSLSESYWASHLVGAGRLIPPAGYLGLYLTASAGAGFGVDPVLRSLDATCMLSYRLGGMEFGLEARPFWDWGLGVLRLPLVLSVGIDRDLRFFAGPALTLGSPQSKDGTALVAAGGLVATLGADWTALRFRVAGLNASLHASVEYDRYEMAAEGGSGTSGGTGSGSSGLGADLGSSPRAGLSLGLRWGF